MSTHQDLEDAYAEIDRRVTERLDHWRFEIDRAFAGGGSESDWFTGRLLRLITSADLVNRERIRLGFPEEVRAYERWHAGNL